MMTICILVCIALILNGCSIKKQEQTLDDKIASEMEYLDKKLSDFLERITGNIEKSEVVVQEKSKLEISSSSPEDSQSNEATNPESSGDTSKEITSMSMQYSDENNTDSDDWSEIKKGVEDLYVSWAIIENDITAKGNITDGEIDKVSDNLDNLLISSGEENQVNFVKETSNMYSNMITILEKIDYNKNNLNVLKTKQKVYESYYNVLEEDWDSAKNNINQANSNLQNIENLENKTNIVFKNLLQSTETKNRKIFFVKYSDAISELNYIII